jgi:hypothetical protein
MFMLCQYTLLGPRAPCRPVFLAICLKKLRKYYEDVVVLYVFIIVLCVCNYILTFCRRLVGSVICCSILVGICVLEF